MADWGFEVTALQRASAAQCERLRGAGVSGSVPVFVDDCAEHVDPVHVRRGGGRRDDADRPGPVWWVQIKRAMWPHTVIVP